MEYDYSGAELARPSPAQIKAARALAGQTQAQAAAMVYRADSARWREWERGAPTGRDIDMAVWELFLIKSGSRTTTQKKIKKS